VDLVAEEQDESTSAAWRRLRLAMISAERSELLRQRNNGDLPDGVLRDLQAVLDLEERALERG
jgi:CPA1 family monovalent cation:H+ antiporter